MTVVGIKIKDVKATREEDISGNISISNTPKITDIKTKKIDSLDKEVLSIFFEHLSEYKTSKATVGKIEIGGEIYFLTEKPKEIAKKWSKNKSLPDEVMVPVLNTIIRKGLIKTIEISEDLQLPPPIRLPIAQKRSK